MQILQDDKEGEGTITHELRVEISRGAHALALVEPATTTVVA